MKKLLFLTLAGLLALGSFNSCGEKKGNDTEKKNETNEEPATETEVAVTEVSLLFSTLDMVVGTSETLSFMITPDNATNKNVTWSSSNSSIVSVDALGTITALSLGSTIVTVTTVDGNKSSSCVVKVIADPTDLVLSVDKSGITADGTDVATFTVTQNGEDVTDNIQICMPSGVCLMSNTFTTTTEGEYNFYAYYTENPDKKSNTVTVTATNTTHKNVLFFTFTATWCGPCWYFKEEMKTFLKKYGDNAVAVNIYTSDSNAKARSENDLYQLFGSKLYSDGFDMGSVPTTYADLSKTDKIVGAAGNSAKISHIEKPYNSRMEHPAQTAISVESAIAEGKVNLTVSVKTKTEGEYQIGVLLIEDNVVCYQNGGGNNYNHMGVARNSASNSVYGEALGTLAVGEVTSKDFSFDTSTYDTSNLSVVVYTLYKEGGKWLVDNSIKAPAEGTTNFK
jgi:thiol-disulfide isomerase/thioredoxin